MLCRYALWLVSLLLLTSILGHTAYIHHRGWSKDKAAQPIGAVSSPGTRKVRIYVGIIDPLCWRTELCLVNARATIMFRLRWVTEFWHWDWLRTVRATTMIMALQPYYCSRQRISQGSGSFTIEFRVDDSIFMQPERLTGWSRKRKQDRCSTNLDCGNKMCSDDDTCNQYTLVGTCINTSRRLRAW